MDIGASLWCVLGAERLYRRLGLVEEKTLRFVNDQASYAGMLLIHLGQRLAEKLERLGMMDAAHGTCCVRQDLRNTLLID